MWLAYWQGGSSPHFRLLLAKCKIQGSFRLQNYPGPQGKTSRHLLRHAPLCKGGTHLWVTSSEQQTQILTQRVKTQTCMSVPCYWVWILSHVRLRTNHSAKFNSCLLAWKTTQKTWMSLLTHSDHQMMALRVWEQPAVRMAQWCDPASSILFSSHCSYCLPCREASARSSRK